MTEEKENIKEKVLDIWDKRGKPIDYDTVKLIDLTIQELQKEFEELKNKIEQLENYGDYKIIEKRRDKIKELEDKLKEKDKDNPLIIKCLNIVWHKKLFPAIELNRIHEIRKRLKYG